MRNERVIACALGLSIALAPTASALALEDVGDDPKEGGEHFGLGVETVLTAPFVPSPVTVFSPAGALTGSYDTGKFRIDGLFLLSFVENAGTVFAVGGRFFYVLHETKSADLSVGAGLALGLVDPKAGDANVRVAMDFGAQLRAFIVENVALTASLGIGFSFGEGGFLMLLGGQLTGSFGLIYYF